MGREKPMSRSYDRYETVDVSDGETAQVAVETQAGTLFVDLSTTERSAEAVVHANTDRYYEADPFRWLAGGGE